MVRLTLIGYRGCGKSTVAAMLSERTGVPWLDADAVVEERAGRSIAALIAAEGEPAFRDLEAYVLADVLAGPPVILATGGGVVLRESNRHLLRSAGRPVVWLQAPADVVRQRIAADPASATRRPGLTSADPLAEVDAALAAREPFYRECADAAFDTAIDAADVVAERILTWIHEWQGAGA